MMSQVYFLELVYLTIGSMMLLSDTHGVKFPILLSLRYAFRSVSWVRHLLVEGGFILGILSIFFPYEPGPPLLGDFLVTVTIFPLVVWYIAIARRQAHGRVSGMVDDAASVIERNKHGLGKAVFLIAVIHFLFPMIVLL